MDCVCGVALSCCWLDCFCGMALHTAVPLLCARIPAGAPCMYVGQGPCVLLKIPIISGLDSGLSAWR